MGANIQPHLEVKVAQAAKLLTRTLHLSVSMYIGEAADLIKMVGIAEKFSLT